MEYLCREMTRSVYQSGFSRNTELMWYTVSPAPLSTGNIFQDCHQVPETVDSAKCYPGRTFGSVQKVIDIWSCPKHPSNIFSIPKSFLKFSPVQNIHKAFGPHENVLKFGAIKNVHEKSSCCGTAETNPTSIHGDDAGSIPGLAQWVGDLAFLWAVV